MKKVLFALILLVGIVSADPTRILVYYDSFGGTGEAVLTAIQNIWPSTELAAYDGYPSAEHALFNDALATGPWDMVIVESWYAANSDLNWTGILNYYNGGGTLYVSSWNYNSAGGLLAAMGVNGVGGFGAPVIPHYAWDTAHPICEGITDWGWFDPGLLTINGRVTVGTATPVTGWTSTSTPGQAGIVVCPDEHSIISGFTVAYANDDVNIWENIVQFMYGESSLTPATWGSIKAGFDI